MSEFHRMVTYLYLYEGNYKTRNIGYAKIEKRDAECRVEIHMKNTGLKDCSVPVYFYTRNSDDFPGILLGSVPLAHGAGDFQELLASADISGTGYDISCIKGIFLPVSEHEMILSQWDDDSFHRNNFIPVSDISETKVSAPEVHAPKTSALEEDTAIPSEPIDLKAAEAAPTPSCQDSDVSDTLSPRLDFIIKNFPDAHPFPSEDSFEWVQLELKDLRLFPKPYWYLGNNSFLLHGFFNYHHLLLGRKKDAQPCQWVMGIPGVFQNPERVMAALFSFPEFRSTSESDVKTGQFGYWLRPLE